MYIVKKWIDFVDSRSENTSIAFAMASIFNKEYR